jgi:nucleoside-diphosphate-sugar epimerase
MVGQALAAKLAQAGHEVMVGTRDPAATLARDEPHPVYGIPPFSVWYALLMVNPRAGRRDAGGALGAAVGRAADAGLQLQGGSVTQPARP